MLGIDDIVTFELALSYAHERCRGIEVWKFNKARQNWLLRNVWSEQAVSSKVIVTIQCHVESYAGTRELLPACDQIPGWYQGRRKRGWYTGIRHTR